MSKVYEVDYLSRYIVGKCTKDDIPITNLHLQKILYYIQREFLQNDDMADVAFYDNIEAWKFGPVVPNVYYEYCFFGSMPIITDDFEDSDFDAEDKGKIDSIVEAKRVLDAWTLVADTHKKNGAWDQIFDNGNGNHKVIPVELIRSDG